MYGLGTFSQVSSTTGIATDQAISELSAFGSPVRPLMVTVILIHAVLVLAFGVGVLRVSGRRSLSWVGGLLIAIGVVGFPTTVWAMSSRGMEGGFNDTMHIVLSAVFSVLVVAAVALSAVAYRGWFRLYALARLRWWLGLEWHPVSRSRASTERHAVGGRLRADQCLRLLCVACRPCCHRDAPGGASNAIPRRAGRHRVNLQTPA